MSAVAEQPTAVNKPEEKPKRKRLTAADILGSSDAQTIDVDVPEWGGIVTLRTLTAGEAIDVADRLKRGEKDSATRVLVMTAVDTEGNQLFSEEDIFGLRRKSLKAVMRVQEAAMILNGMKEPEKEREEAKNG